jgi:quercetin dioxygenase-like cupin family protein
MNKTDSSCELTAPGQTVQGSRVLRFGPGFRWEGVAVADYKDPADHWCGIARMCLVGENGESTGFQLRYFEIAPGGFSSFERHAHEHAVVVLRGHGEVQLGEASQRIGFGDIVYVAPHEPHQFRNPSTDEPFGFLCVVDTERDRPTLLR